MDVDLVLALEIIVERPFGQFGRLGDVVHPGLVIAVFGEDMLGRGLDRRQPRLFLALPSFFHTHFRLSGQIIN